MRSGGKQVSRRLVLGCAVLAVQLVIALPAHAGVTIPGITGATGVTGQKSAATLPTPRPSWYTAKLNRRVLAAGYRGVQVRLSKKQAALDPDCLGYAPPSTSPPGLKAVAAGTCMVAPFGCTMNFIFTDGTSNYIGTAGHCVAKGGAVVAQVATRIDPTDSVVVTLAAIGRTVKKMNNGIGQDFGLVKIDPGWPVVPGIAGAAGPTGTFCGDPVGQPVIHYGHGYIFLVEQGVPKAGEVIPDLNAVVPFKSTQYGYNWVGYGLPGDSGSPVMNAAGLATGDLTHGLAIAGVPIPGLNFGTDMAGIFNFLGAGYSLVTADGRKVNCSGLVGV